MYLMVKVRRVCSFSLCPHSANLPPDAAPYGRLGRSLPDSPPDCRSSFALFRVRLSSKQILITSNSCPACHASSVGSTAPSRRHLPMPVTPEVVIRIPPYFNAHSQTAISSDQERCSLPIPTLDSRSPLLMPHQKHQKTVEISTVFAVCIVHRKMIS